MVKVRIPSVVTLEEILKIFKEAAIVLKEPDPGNGRLLISLTFLGSGFPCQILSYVTPQETTQGLPDFPANPYPVLLPVSSHVSPTEPSYPSTC